MADAKERRPILVTGCPRSGTTWLGKTIGACRNVVYVYEPFNDGAPHNLNLPERFIALDDSNAGPYRDDIAALFALGDLPARAGYALRGLAEYKKRSFHVASRLAARIVRDDLAVFLNADRVCVKDPLAFFSAEWVAETYNARNVVLVRHPAGVISSYLSLGWDSEITDVIARQSDETRQLLACDNDAYLAGQRTTLDGLILQWKIFTAETLRLKRLHPDWSFIIHDHLCEAPDAYVKGLFAHLSLEFTDEIAAIVKAETQAQDMSLNTENARQHQHKRRTSDLVHAWRSKLEPQIIGKILEQTTDLWNETEARLKRTRPLFRKRLFPDE